MVKFTYEVSFCMKFHRLTIDQKILFMTRFIYPLLLYNMYNKIRNGIYKKLREFKLEIDPEINTGFQSQNSHQPVEWISWGKEKIYFTRNFTFAPIWFPHWPAWMCTISRMLKPFEMRLFQHVLSLDSFWLLKWVVVYEIQYILHDGCTSRCMLLWRERVP